MANTVLLQRMLKAREETFAVADDEGNTDRLKITIRRPTILRHAEVVFSKPTQVLDILGPCIVGWDGFEERDIVQSGGDEPVAFDRELAIEWVGDRVEIERQLSGELNRMIKAYLERRGNLEKN